MNIEQAKEAIKLVIKDEQFVTPFIQGKPGVGKSAIVHQLAKELELENVIDFRLSQHESTDLKGIPRPTKDGKLEWMYPDYLPLEGTKWEGTSGILFLDELNRADNYTLQGVFQLVYDRKIGERKLLPDWRIICAGNLGYEDDTDVNEMDAALKDRFLTLIVDDVDVDTWMNWAINNKINRFILSFLREHPSKIYVTGENSHGKYLITPRKWEIFSKILSANESNEIQVARTIGFSYIYELTPTFLKHLESALNVSVNDIIENFKSVKDKIAQLERSDVYSITNELVQKIIDNKYGKKQVKNISEFMKAALDEDAQIAFIVQLHKDKLNTKNENVKTFMDLFWSLNPDLNKSGSRFVDMVVKSML